MYRRFLWGAGFMLVIALLLVNRAGLYAQTSRQCFTETGFCIEGRFLQFWQQNGGLPVFGLPITAPKEQVVETGQFVVQWFERARFELHPENGTPYDVLLGRLGDDRLRQLERDWQSELRAGSPQSGCLWFAQTRHNVCNQSGSLGFQTYWQGHGLQDPQLGVYGRSLALFGLPLTEPRMELNAADGKLYLTQWFERARFEWHPNEPNDQYKVLLGLLGNEVFVQNLPETPTQALPTAAPPTVTSSPTATSAPKRPSPSPKPTLTSLPFITPDLTATPSPTKTLLPIPTPPYLYLAFGALDSTPVPQQRCDTGMNNPATMLPCASNRP